MDPIVVTLEDQGIERPVLNEQKPRKSPYKWTGQRKRSGNRGLRGRLDAIKSCAGCCHCGIRYPEVLHFHHRDPDEKEFSLSRLPSHHWEDVSREIAKCDIVCSNCHALIHSGRLVRM